MTYFTEVELSQITGGRIASVSPESAAAAAGLKAGDELLTINENRLQDVIDVQYYGAEEDLVLVARRDGGLLELVTQRDYGQELGLEFIHPTFDTDIRRCNNLCEFCFVLQMAPRFRRTLYIKDDDYRYSFLFGHYVTLTNLSEHDWWRIKTMRLSPLFISVHTTDLEMRRSFLRNPKAPDIMEQLEWLARHRIEMHTQIVVVPEFNDGEWLSRSLLDLAELWPQIRSVSIVPVGLTRHHKYDMRIHRLDEVEETIQLIESYQPGFSEQFGVNFTYLTDEWYLRAERPIPGAGHYDGLSLQENGLGMVRDFLDDWQAVQNEIDSFLKSSGSHPARPFPASMTWVTGTLFYETLRSAAVNLSERLNIGINVIPITNRRLGESITVAGLLMAEDIVVGLGDVKLGDVVVLPRITFDHPETITLDDMSPMDIASKISREVALADGIGDVWDYLTGKSKLVFKPE